MGEIDSSRHETHTIYNIAELMNHTKCNFTRNSNFPYSEKKGQPKKYEAKSAELKVETYKNENQQERDGIRLGHFKLNLAQFIGTGLRTITYCMDKDQSIFLTAKISVVEGNDILSMTMKSVISTNQGAASMTNVDDDDSEEEVPGEQLMQTYKHFYHVHKDNAEKQPEIINNESIEGDNEDQKNAVQKVGKQVGKLAANAVQSAIGISSTVSGVAANTNKGNDDKYQKMYEEMKQQCEAEKKKWQRV